MSRVIGQTIGRRHPEVKTGAPGEGVPAYRAMWAALLGMVAVVICAAPYVIGAMMPWPGHVFTAVGALDTVFDLSQYTSAIRQGMSGHILFTNQFTDSPMRPILMYPLYTLTGFVFRASAAPPELLYVGVHLCSVATFLVVAWRLCARFAPDAPLRAYGLVVFGGGLVLEVLCVQKATSIAVGHLVGAEFSPFFNLLFTAHGTLSLAIEAGLFLAYLAWIGTGGRRYLVAMGLCAIALGCVYPFLLDVVYAVVCVDTVAATVVRKRDGCDVQMILRRRALPLLALGPSVCFPLYYAQLLYRDPLWRQTALLHLATPPLSVLIILFGPLLGCALAGVYAQRHVLGVPRVRIVVVWGLVNGLIVMAPLPQAERALQGWVVPLAVLSAWGIASWRPWIVQVATTAVLGGSTAPLTALYVFALVSRASPAFYADAGTAQLLHYLVYHAGPSDVILGTFPTSNVLVGQVSGRVVNGHPMQTPHWSDVETAVDHYYSGVATPVERRRFEQRHRVSLVVVDAHDAGLRQSFTRAHRYTSCYAKAAYVVYAIGRCPVPVRPVTPSLFE